MFFIIITASKGIESVVCRRNLFRGKKQIKGKEGGARARLARLLKDFRDGWARGSGVGEIGKKKSRLEQGAEKIQTEKLCPREAEFIVCPRSISPVFFSSSPTSCPYTPRRLVHFGLVGNILTISFSYRYPSCYEVRITRAVYVLGAPGPP